MNPARRQSHQPTPPENPTCRQYPLSETLNQLAAIAPTLKEAELRVLLHLVAKSAEAGKLTIRASSREIAENCKCARSHAKAALHSLADRGLIATREGSATQASAHMLRFLEVETIRRTGGPAADPPANEGGPRTVGPQRTHPGPAADPPPTENGELPRPPSRLDIEPDRLTTLDRVLTTKTRQIPRDLLQEFRRLITHTAAKMGRAYERPPDNDSMAQLAQACDGRVTTLHWLMVEMHREQRQPGESPMWWVTVALQRIHGIDARKQQLRRAELRATNKPRIVEAATAQTEEEEMQAADFQRELLKLAAGRTLR